MKKYMLGMGMLCAASLAAAQTPKAEQAMDTKRQHIAAVAALTGRGDLAGLESALAAGLDDGMTVNELKEVMVHAYAYCGFPRALRGLQTLVGVLDGRKAAGVEVNWGREASPITNGDATFSRRSPVSLRMRRKPIMPCWLPKSKCFSKSISSPTFSSATC